jgi:predicted Zn-dependent peptidase
MDKRFSNIKLKNGIRLLYVPVKGSSTVYIEYCILNGTINENQDTLEHGHILEHMNAKFTSKKYPNAVKNIEEMNNLGCQSNASINDYMTKYYIEGLADYKDYFTDLVLNAYIDPVIDSNIFTQEKQSVVEELQSGKNYMWHSLDNKINSTLYSGHPKSFTLQQSISNTKKTSLKDLEKFRKNFYKTTSTLFVIAGDFDRTYINNKIINILSTVEKSHDFDNKYPAYQYNGNKIPKLLFVKNSNATTTKIHIRFQVPYTVFKGNQCMLDVLPILLTSDLNSRLYVLRHKYGFVYYVSSKFLLDYFNEDLSAFIIETEVDSKYVKKTIKIIKDELDKFKSTLISDNEMKRVKNVFRFEQKQHVLSNYTPDYVRRYREYALFGKEIVSFATHYKKRNKITKKHIQLISQQILQNKNMFIAYSGKLL